MAQRKVKQVNVRVSPSQLKKWQESADAAGVSLGQWIRFQCDGVMVVRAIDKAA